jgi:hypothetical protein
MMNEVVDVKSKDAGIIAAGNNDSNNESDNEKAKTGSANNDTEEAADAKSSIKQRINLAVIAGVLVVTFLLLVFVPKYLQESRFDDDKYNNYQFVKDSEGYWQTYIEKQDQPYAILFHYHPSELEDVVVEAGLRAKFFLLRNNSGSVYIAIDPDSPDNTVVIAGVEIAKITGERYGLLGVPTFSAFIKQPTNVLTDIVTPVVNCSKANDTTMVVRISLSNKNLVSSRGNCIILEAASYHDTVRVADRLAYHILGIMN